MAVLLTISSTVTGSEYADALEGGGTGIDFGAVSNGQYTPLISQPANTGHLDFIIRHDATVDPITDVKTFLQQYGVGTGFTYGGPRSAAIDFAKILDMGNASASANANNSDGLANGNHIDMDWDVATANQFDPARIATGFVRIYGDNGGSATGDGRNLATAFTMKLDAMSYWNGASEVAPTTAENGKIGKSSDSVLGNRAHPRMRIFLRSDETDGGILQYELVTAYSFTA